MPITRAIFAHVSTSLIQGPTIYRLDADRVLYGIGGLRGTLSITWYRYAAWGQNRGRSDGSGLFACMIRSVVILLLPHNGAIIQCSSWCTFRPTAERSMGDCRFPGKNSRSFCWMIRYLPSFNYAMLAGEGHD